jgi:sugar-phosphatase
MYEDQIRALLPEGVTATTAGNEWIDIQNTGVNKGAGIRLLQKKLHIKKEECAAFGDAMNDYTLLQNVKYSYAMKNADDRIKAIARQTLPWTNEEQGVIKQIRNILNDQYV